MSRLSKEDYREAVGCLKRYNYNCINIMNIQSDILSLSIAPADGMPKAPYAVSNTVLNKVIQMEENESLQRSIREYKIVVQALQLVDSITKEIFKEEYQKRKWKQVEYYRQITYKRRYIQETQKKISIFST